VYVRVYDELICARDEANVLRVAMVNAKLMSSYPYCLIILSSIVLILFVVIAVSSEEIMG